jgi:hypothetical protein
LRFRVATPDDLAFFENASPELKGDASDINLKCIREKAIFQSHSRQASDKTVRVSNTCVVRYSEDVASIVIKIVSLLSQFRVQPYPDPDRVQQTEWLSKEELSKEAFKPSKKWVEAGDGEVGRVYVEIIGCKDLPNMVRERKCVNGVDVILESY